MARIGDSEGAATCGPVRDWTRGAHCVEVQFRQGRLRIEAVAGDILRVRFAPEGAFAPRRSWDVVETPAPASLEVSESDAGLRLRTSALTAELDRGDGRLRFLDPAGRVFAGDLSGPRWRELALEEIPALASAPDAELPAGPARIGVSLDKRLHPEEGCFGLGQRSGRLNRRHRRLSNWTVDPSTPGHGRGDDNLYQAHPVCLAVRPGLAWGLFLHSTWYSSFDIGSGREEGLGLFTLGGELDYYLFAGPTPAAVVEQLTRITGRPALPPLWALGFHQSRWSYPSDAAVRALAAEFRQRRIPIDAIHLDIDYMRGYRVFTWDKSRFPDPAATVARLHAQGIRAVTIVDPGVKHEPGAGYAVVDEGLAQGHFIQGPDGRAVTGHVWPGESLFPDYCRASTRRWWGELHAGLVAAGVDGIWCDMNEPSIVDRPYSQRGVRDHPIPLAAPQGGDDGPATHAEAHNLYGLLMARATAEGLVRLRPQRRPWVLTRSAYAGVQRHAATWMGDNRSCWEDLALSLPQLAGMGLCGAPHAGVDIGGFYGNAWGELYARWMELAPYYPFMRCHTSLGSRDQEPWAFGPEVEAIAREAIQWRYRLLPYLYTLAHLAQRRGEPLLRPLLYDFPDQPRLHEIGDQAMLGPLLMVAPVCRPGAVRRLVELPQGDWYDYWRGRRVGPGPLLQEAPPGRAPLFVPAGAILTLGNLRQSTAEPLTELTLEVFPGRDGDWTLIEDAGEGLDYRRGGLAETRFAARAEGERLRVEVSPRAGGYTPPARTLRLQVHLVRAPSVVRRDGANTQAWRWRDDRRCVELSWPDDGLAHDIVIGGAA